MLRKLKFYFIGLVPGLVVVFFILNKKGVSCSGYLPNSRVIAETLSKKMEYSTDARQQMSSLQVDEKFIKDSIFVEGEIDFERSHAQKKPSPNYVLHYPKKNPKYEVAFEKCDDNATINSIKKIQ